MGEVRDAAATGAGRVRADHGYERLLDHVGEERIRAYLEGTDT